MSLATLKRKSAVGQNLSSNKIFSTKGVIRNLRGIGSSPQITSDVRTIFKGGSPMVCGGRAAQSYEGHPNIGTCKFNVESAPTSTMTTKGLLSSRVYHPVIKSSECAGSKNTTWWVKNFNPLDHSQS